MGRSNRSRSPKPRRPKFRQRLRLRLQLLKSQARLLFGGEQPWTRSETVGPQALRLQALKLVGSFERWLDRAELQQLVATLPPGRHPRP